MLEVLGLDTIFAELIIALGLALVIGNALAWMRDARGRRPPEARGEFRKGRAVFLAGVGTLMIVWGLASLLGAGPGMDSFSRRRTTL